MNTSKEIVTACTMDCPDACSLRVQVQPSGQIQIRGNPRALLCRRGGWLSRGEGVNQLVDADITDIGGGTAFYQTHVRLEKV